MNRTKRDRLLGYISKGRFFGRETTEALDCLRDYVDTLEAACKRAADIAVVMSHSAEREIYIILSEALDKGK